MAVASRLMCPASLFAVVRLEHGLVDLLRPTVAGESVEGAR
jgi:hypothetical protein